MAAPRLASPVATKVVLKVLLFQRFVLSFARAPGDEAMSGFDAQANRPDSMAAKNISGYDDLYLDGDSHQEKRPPTGLECCQGKEF
jgi:hypothetical protein